MTSLDDLMTPLTRTEAETLIYGIFSALEVPTSSWKPGSVARALVTANAIAVSMFSSMVALIAKAQFLDTAKGNWLKLNAWYNYNTAPIDGTFPAGIVSLTNSGGGIYTVAAGSLILKNPTSGATFSNTNAFVLNALSVLPINVVGQIKGSLGNALPGEIDTFVTPLVGVTCSNALSVLGTDAETEDSLRARARGAAASISPNGPADVYRAVALAAVRQDGTSIGVTQVKLGVAQSSVGADTFWVIAAGESGGISGVATDPTTDLGALALAIQDQACPSSVNPVVMSAVSEPIAIESEVWIHASSGLTTGQVQSQVAKSVADWLAAKPIGGDSLSPDVLSNGTIYAEAITSAIHAANPSIFRVALAVPFGDVVINAGWKVTLSSIATIVHVVP